MKQHVLIVEDNPANSELLRIGWKWKVRSGDRTYPGRRVRALKKRQPDWCMLDDNLRKDGLSLQRGCPAAPKDIPVIA